MGRMSALAVAGAAMVAFSPNAMATYYSYGPMKAYEGSVFVAEGKGNHGVDFTNDVIGGHIGARDPRPGGSPALGKIWYQYSGGTVSPWYSLEGNNNYTSTWRDDPKYGNLNTGYSIAETYGQICQNDTWPARDDCTNSPSKNHKW